MMISDCLEYVKQGSKQMIEDVKMRGRKLEKTKSCSISLIPVLDERNFNFCLLTLLAGDEEDWLLAGRKSSERQCGNAQLEDGTHVLQRPRGGAEGRKGDGGKGDDDGEEGKEEVETGGRNGGKHGEVWKSHSSLMLWVLKSEGLVRPGGGGGGGMKRFDRSTLGYGRQTS
eukprot:749145-Hanusia_phi.AAC.1